MSDFPDLMFMHDASQFNSVNLNLAGGGGPPMRFHAFRNSSNFVVACLKLIAVY